MIRLSRSLNIPLSRGRKHSKEIRDMQSVPSWRLPSSLHWCCRHNAIYSLSKTAETDAWFMSWSSVIENSCWVFPISVRPLLISLVLYWGSYSRSHSWKPSNDQLASSSAASASVKRSSSGFLSPAIVVVAYGTNVKTLRSVISHSQIPVPKFRANPRLPHEKDVESVPSTVIYVLESRPSLGYCSYANYVGTHSYAIG